MPKKGFPLKSWIILYYLDAGDPVMNGWWRFGCDLEESILLVCDISQKNIEKQFQKVQELKRELKKELNRKLKQQPKKELN